MRFVALPDAEDFMLTNGAFYRIPDKEQKPWQMFEIRGFPKGDQERKRISVIGYPQDDEKSAELAANFESEEFHAKDLCRPWAGGRKGFFLDVGASIGACTLAMADCIQGQGAVVAIEGVPEVADHLRGGIVANKLVNIGLYGFVVGAGSAPNATTGQFPERGTESGQDTVKETTIDAILRNDRRLKGVLSMKVDIGGKEGRMLQGAKEFFSQVPPCYLTIKLAHEALTSAGTPVEDVLEKLEKFGYANLPTAEFLKDCPQHSRTIHLYQKDLEACRTRADKVAQKLENYRTSHGFGGHTHD